MTIGWQSSAVLLQTAVSHDTVCTALISKGSGLKAGPSIVTTSLFVSGLWSPLPSHYSLIRYGIESNTQSFVQWRGHMLTLHCKRNNKKEVLEYCFGWKESCDPHSGNFFFSTEFYVSFAHTRLSTPGSCSIWCAVPLVVSAFENSQSKCELWVWDSQSVIVVESSVVGCWWSIDRSVPMLWDGSALWNGQYQFWRTLVLCWSVSTNVVGC